MTLSPNRHLLFAVLFPFCLNAQSLCINEVQASNTETLADAAGEYDDWIELFNGADELIDLSGCYLSDDADVPLKWQIPPNTLLDSGGYLLIWADNQPHQGPLHAAFKCSADGEMLLLTAADGQTRLDSISFPAMDTDLSWGWSQEGIWSLQWAPTPGAPNGTGLMGVLDAPDIQPLSGVYADSVQIIITPPDSLCRIHFTLDGNWPTVNSPIYSEPLAGYSSMVIRAMAVRNGYHASAAENRTYVIDEHFSLPVLSVMGNPDDFFSADRGITMNPRGRGPDWERAVHVQFIESSKTEFTVDCGIRLQGGSGRFDPKQAFRFYFRSEYGPGKLHYPLFGSQGMDSFDRIVIKGGGDDHMTMDRGTMLRDPLLMEFWARLGHLSCDNRFVMLYINGSLYGIYSMFEDIEEVFVEDHTGLKDIDIIRLQRGYWELAYGSDESWRHFLNLVLESGPITDPLYEQIAAEMDLDDFIDLMVLVQYAGYTTWTRGCSVYREKSEQGRWRWVIWDCDRALLNGVVNAYVQMYNNTDETTWPFQIFAQLMGHRHFKQRFMNRLMDLNNTVFLESEVLQLADSLASCVAADVYHDELKWEVPVGTWQNGWNHLRSTLSGRSMNMKFETLGYFALTDRFLVQVYEADHGSGYQLNSLTLPNAYWKGQYFSDFPITVIPCPEPGYEFDHWVKPAGAEGDTLILNPCLDLEFEAAYKVKYDTSASAAMLRISEFFYNSSESYPCCDWVEIVNAGPDSIRTDDWSLGDGNQDHRSKLPKLAVPPGGRLVLSREIAAFGADYGDSVDLAGCFDFGLGSDDSIVLVTPFGQMADSVCYSCSVFPFSAANGTGHSMERLDSLSSGWNSDNWVVSRFPGGTPGQSRSSASSAVETDQSGPDFQMMPCQPNPFIHQTCLTVVNRCPGEMRLSVYNSRGQCVATLVSGWIEAGTHRWIWRGVDDDGAPLPSGIYIASISCREERQARKMALIR